MKTYIVTVYRGNMSKTALINADYFEVENGSFYFYETAPEEGDVDCLKAVYPVANTVIKSIIHTDEDTTDSIEALQLLIKYSRFF